VYILLGNICRSPMAEAVFKKTVSNYDLRNNFECIESAGTAGYHVGDSPDPRTISVCKANDTPINSFAQQLQKSDFEKFDYIIGMDKSNVSNILRVKPKNSKSQVKLFGEFGDGKQIDDPYYGSDDGFERVYRQCEKYSKEFLINLGL
ncbi:protein-tyrosine phosphatase, partial [Phakopsora pachyrhizi]